MAWSNKSTDLEMRVRPISTADSTMRSKPEDAAIEQLGYKATLPRTLTSGLGIVGTISTVVCPWPSALAVAPLCLANGGTGGLLVGFVVSSFFMMLVYYLLAEKLPLTPTAGGQYHMAGWPQWVGGLLGFSYCTGVLGGFDCATHLAEDTKNPGTEIPKSLLLSTTVNSFSCIVVAILVTVCAGDVNLFLGPLAVSGHPLGTILQLFFDATRGNKSAAFSVFALSAIIFAVCCVNTTATSSRMLFSLIRDGRDPIVGKVMAKDLNKEGLPRRCVLLAGILPLVILWINFVSSVGFQAIVSQVTLALILSYSLVMACALESRISRPELLGHDREGFWRPGRSWGIALDIAALVFLFIVGLLCW